MALDRESRRYIHVNVINVIETYDTDGKVTKTKNNYPLVLCKENYFDS